MQSTQPPAPALVLELCKRCCVSSLHHACQQQHYLAGRDQDHKLCLQCTQPGSLFTCCHGYGCKQAHKTIDAPHIYAKKPTKGPCGPSHRITTVSKTTKYRHAPSAVRRRITVSMSVLSA
eukprot:390785-Rhodomonas_salina.1